MRFVIVFCVSLLVAGLLITACNPKPLTQWVAAGTGKLTNVQGLEDCTYTEVATGGGEKLKVIRCPSSSTSVNYTEQQGKNRVERDTYTIDEETLSHKECMVIDNQQWCKQ